ncbi:MAG: glycosyltransferase [Gemmatimonadota bacterium]
MATVRTDTSLPNRPATSPTRAGVIPTGANPQWSFEPPAARPSIDLSRIEPPPILRPGASLSVLDITKYFGDATGGIRTYLLEKARYVGLHPELRQVLLVPGARDALMESDGVRCYRLRGPRIPTQDAYRFLLATRTTRRLFEHERPDIVEVGSPFLVPWLAHHANQRLRAPMVWFYHTNYPRIIAPGSGATRWRSLGADLAWRHVRRVSRLFAATFAASDAVARDLERVGVERVVRIALGVDLVRFTPARRDSREEARARAGLPEGPLAIFAGRFAQEKQIDVLVRAWPAIERRTGATLVLVGDGPQRPALAAAAAGGRITFLPYQGDRDRLADLLAAADMYIAPGPVETFGLAALEAMASGTPVLSVDRGAVPEHVNGSGAGALYACGDSSALADAAIRLLESDLPALGVLARRYAELNHAWPVVLDGLFQAYRQILAGPPQ